MIRITPDTNILVSALVFGGKPRELLERAINGDVELVISPDIVAEVVGVLRDKFRFGDEQLSSVSERLRDTCTITPMNPPRLEPIAPDPDDDRIIECAVDGSVAQSSRVTRTSSTWHAAAGLTSSDFQIFSAGWSRVNVN